MRCLLPSLTLLLCLPVSCGDGGVCVPAADAPPGVYACDPALVRDVGLGDTIDAAGPADAASEDGGGGDGSGDAYPAGPYGHSVGDTIANLELTTADGARYALDTARTTEGVALILVSTAAGWCTACREEQPALVALHETYARDGLLVIVAVFEDDFLAPATAAYASGWARQYGLPFPALVDADNLFGAYYDSALAPMNLFIDAGTMEIVRVGIGFDESATRALIEATL